jgi:hypothetical protein
MYMVGIRMYGSIRAVSAIGIISMSDSLIAWNPRIDEPSNPTPSSKMSSSTSAIDLDVCCQVPRRSENRKSTIWTPASLAICITSAGVFAIGAPLLTRTAWKVFGALCPGRRSARDNLQL